MKKIIKDRRIVEDAWRLLEAEENWQSLPATAQIIVPFEQWQTDYESLLAHFTQGVGVALENTVEPETIVQLEKIALITIHFPMFNDGRGYSLARILREQLQYAGEIRAVGDVLRDQLFYLARCGFNAFDLKPHENMELEQVLSAFSSFSKVYQPMGV